MAEKYITLKEAASISGYSPDYVGQLIRQGKLPGKQVYYNVAWVTTESAVRAYVDNSRKKPSLLNASAELSRKLMRGFLSEERIERIMNGLLYFGLSLAAITAVIFFYIIVVSIDAKLEARALESINIE